MRFACLIFTILFAIPAFASAQVELGNDVGGLSATASDVAIRHSAKGNVDFRDAWQGPTFDAQVLGGMPATRWRSATFSTRVDLAQNGIATNHASLPTGIEVLEFADGLNMLTVSAYRRWYDVVSGVTPYIRNGVGMSLPQVEVTNAAAEMESYQFTGPAATWVAGARLPLSDQWTLFGEFKGTYAAATADLDSSDTLTAKVVANALNVGVSFDFYNY